MKKVIFNRNYTEGLDIRVTAQKEEFFTLDPANEPTFYLLERVSNGEVTDSIVMFEEDLVSILNAINGKETE